MMYPTLHFTATNDPYLIVIDNETRVKNRPIYLSPTTNPYEILYDLLWNFIDQYNDGFEDGFVEGVENEYGDIL